MKVQEADIPIPPEDPLLPGEEEDPIPPEDADQDEDVDYTQQSAWKTIHRIIDLGHARKKELDRMKEIPQGENGRYCIRNAGDGYGSDFHDQANLKYLKEKYKFLHEFESGIGIDDDKAIATAGSVEEYLARISEEDWDAFKEDMESLEDYPLLDEEGSSELEQEEVGRWITEDGGPDLIKEMRDAALDAYEGYLLSKVTIGMVFAWCSETDHYPEAQGEGSVWMDMDDYAQERETQEWFLEQVGDDQPGWLAVKRSAYEAGAFMSNHSIFAKELEPGERELTVGETFDHLLRDLATEDEEIAHVYNRIDGEILWKMFLAAFPDERQENEAPYWYFWKKIFEEPGNWRPGYPPDQKNTSNDWKDGFYRGLAYLKNAPWFLKIIKTWFNQPPEGHPQFKFKYESVDQTGVGDFNPDDPETFMRHGGGVEEDLVYEDDKIVVMCPRDIHALNYHLRLSGIREIEQKNWNDLFKYRDVFVVLGKQPTDMLGHVTKRELAIIFGNNDEELRIFNNAINPMSLDQLMSTPEYGNSIRRMLLQVYRERIQSDDKAGTVLLQLGGPVEIRRAQRRGHLSSDAFSIQLGLHYVKRHKYALAAKMFGRKASTVIREGVWLIFDGIEDLIPLFSNPEGAKTVFAHDHYDWWNYNLPDDVSDVFPFLDAKAIAHIREVMVNRSVWFPDAGPEQQGDYVVLTQKILSGYTDKEILDWIDRPSDEDRESEVFEDIIEAIKRCGARLIEGATLDKIYSGYVKSAVDAIDGKEHKWIAHPINKNGDDAFSVFVKWSFVADWVQEYSNERGSDWDGTLEDLAIEVNHKKADPDASNMEADWRDIDKEYAKELLDEIYELTPPDPPDPDPNQTMLPLPESEEEDLDKPSSMPMALSGIPIEFEKRVKAELKDIAEAHGMVIEGISFDLSWVTDVHSKLVTTVRLDHEPDLEYMSEEWKMWHFTLRKIRGWVDKFFPNRRDGDGVFVDRKGKAFFYSGSEGTGEHKKLSLDNCVRVLFALRYDDLQNSDADYHHGAARGRVIHGAIQPAQEA